MSTTEPLGIPHLVDNFSGIDVLGRNCRISETVTVFRALNHYSASGIFLGDEVVLFNHVRLLLGEIDVSLRIGNRVIVNVGGYLSGEGGMTIEDDVLIGPHVRLLSAGHQIHNGDPIVARNQITYGSIHVGRGAWIGGGATVIEGVSIGEGAVIGAGSVVTKDVPSFAVAIGNPARVVHYRKGHVSSDKKNSFWAKAFSRFLGS